MKSKNDRRSRQRVTTRLPVRVKSAEGAELAAETRDVSTNGVFLYTKSRMTEGSDVELVLILPPELTSGEKCWVCCHARVLRVEHGPVQILVSQQKSGAWTSCPKFPPNVVFKVQRTESRCSGEQRPKLGVAIILPQNFVEISTVSSEEG